MEKILKQKRIDYLLHFTRAENLENILKYGLLPKNVLLYKRIPTVFNDEYRYDNCEDAVCTSIEFPNYKMFYTLRQDNPEVDWVVLLLDAKILCNFDCAFCCENAGSANMYQTDIESRKGIKAFLKLFDEQAGCYSRKEMNLPSYYPTNPQAEVLVFANIPVEYIKCVYFYNYKTMNKYANLFDDTNMCKVNTYFFYGRKDYNFWQN